MNEWELKIRNKNIHKRMKLLMKNSLKYCVIESYKIYSETIKSEVDIRHLRKNIWNTPMKKTDNTIIMNSHMRRKIY